MVEVIDLILAAVFFSFSFARARQSGKLVKLME
jgi:hypothetical protein